MATTDLDIKGALIDSGHKFRKDILLMPVVGLGETRTHMTTRFDVRGKETVGEARSGARIRPYRTAKDATNAMLSLLNSQNEEGQVAQKALRTNRDFNTKGEVGGKIGNNSKIY